MCISQRNLLPFSQTTALNRHLSLALEVDKVIKLKRSYVSGSEYVNNEAHAKGPLFSISAKIKYCAKGH